MKKSPIFLSLLFFAQITLAQATIQLKNPSFEDTPRHSHVPSGWKNCGQEFESPPDTQPEPTFGVNTKAFDGKTYLGLVVRDNDTWEQVGQSLSDPLMQGKCYSFSLLMAKSATYNSASRRTGKAATYTTPVVVRIWGGNANCDKQEMLAISEPVDNVEWLEYPFLLSPIKGNYSHLLIEAYYKDRYGDAYNGNVLIDHASDLRVVDCTASMEERQQVIAEAPVEKEKYLELNKLTLPKEVYADQFWEWVEEYGPKITFDENNALSTDFYTLENGDPTVGNVYFHFLTETAQMLSQTSKFYIYVYGEDADVVSKRKASLDEALQKWNIQSGQVKIFSQMGDLSPQKEDQPENVRFFMTEQLGFYLIQ